MSKLFATTLFTLLCLATNLSHAQTVNSESDLSLSSDSEIFENEDMSAMARRRPRPTVYRCCAKPHGVPGVMNCSQSTDKLLSWSDAVINCEQKYGKGNCVSGCRRLNAN